jgi:hypothetical protein
MSETRGETDRRRARPCTRRDTQRQKSLEVKVSRGVWSILGVLWRGHVLPKARREHKRRPLVVPPSPSLPPSPPSAANATEKRTRVAPSSRTQSKNNTTLKLSRPHLLLPRFPLLDSLPPRTRRRRTHTQRKARAREREDSHGGCGCRRARGTARDPARVGIAGGAPCAPAAAAAGPHAPRRNSSFSSSSGQSSGTSRSSHSERPLRARHRSRRRRPDARQAAGSCRSGRRERIRIG